MNYHYPKRLWFYAYSDNDNDNDNDDDDDRKIEIGIVQYKKHHRNQKPEISDFMLRFVKN